ncbi:hypothetical protein PFX98_00290 [Paucibacter sediminis]|uniref:Lysozyme inhibitor LprI N-terminal domain-containing protein n=1 Tax=Paucibacter sediminis TaxID=3019553 RepID=A0AA95NBC3_9BURK|nr:hypothetical protein [Paucibacter sp. S2-9]WIT12075.1 hypothetical protein PFX98_00290 [Paucibacter sp. S2-9]
MNHAILRFSACLLAASLAGLSPGTSLAADGTPLARYQQERTACLAGQTNQDRSTCLREAGAAYAEARRGGLEGDEESWRRNALRRCEVLQGDERFDCLARMQGQGQLSGSALGGGIYRELVTVVPAASAPTPAK